MSFDPTLLKNSKGNIWYGMHFYPGVAEYQEPDQKAYRVFLNEDTLREMDPTFAGRPVFVQHVDEVTTDLTALKKEADGWVIESFYNPADGKHWAKFITVDEKADDAIKKGLRLSNAYVPKKYGPGGLWNGVEYDKEILSGEFEHLALVSNPRYEESVVMTPDQFKKYNEDKLEELKKLSNSKKEKETIKMKFSFFKRERVENNLDLENMTVMLPKTKKEVTLSDLITNADEMEEKKEKNEVMAEPSHMVKLHDGSMMNVGELLEKHKELHDEMVKMKDEAEKEKKEDELEEEEELEPKKKPVDSESSEEMHDESDDEEAKKKALELAEHEEKEIEAAKDKKKNALEKAKRLREAHLNALKNEEAKPIELMADQVARGKARYGSR